jgi:voltage-gated potassium channel
MRARGFISALPTDAENVFVILSAKTLNPKLTVVTRAAEEGAEEKLRRAGADIVFSPYSMAGQRLAQALVRPHVAQFMNFAAQGMGLDVSIEEFRVDRTGVPGLAIVGDLVARRDLGVIVLAMRKANGPMLFNPALDTPIEAGDFVIAIGKQPQLRNIGSLLTSE